MPYTKQQQPFLSVARLLKGYGVTATALSGETGWSCKKSTDRIAHPDRLSLSEIAIIVRRFHIPTEEMLEAVSKW